MAAKLFNQDLFDTHFGDQPIEPPQEPDRTPLDDNAIEENIAEFISRGRHLYELAFDIARFDRSPRSVEVAGKVVRDMVASTIELRKLKSTENQQTQEGNIPAGAVFHGTLSDLLNVIKDAAKP